MSRTGDHRFIGVRWGRIGLIVCFLAVGVAAMAAQTITAGNAGELSVIAEWSTQGVPVSDLAYLHEGTRVIAVHGNRVSLWDVASGELVASWTAHPGFAAGLDLSPDGTMLATVGSDAILKMWNIASGDLVRSLAPAGTHAVAFSPDGSLIASGARTGILRVWRVATGELMHEIDAGSRMFSVAYSPDGLLLATAHGLPDFAVRVWSAETGELVWESFEHFADAHVIAFSPNGETIASVEAAGRTMLWDTATGEMLRILGGEGASLFELLFLSDELLATGDGGGAIRFWNPQTGLLVHALSAYRSEVSALAVSPDGTGLATASFDMRAVVFGFPEE